MTQRDRAAFILLAALWGGSFLLIRIAVPAFGPVALATVRTSLAGTALMFYALAIGTIPPLRGWWRPLFVVGAINTALPFLLIMFAQQWLPASTTAILIATSPLFGAIFVAAHERRLPSQRTIVGIALGVIGVVVLVGWQGVETSGPNLLAICSVVTAAVCYGLAATFVRVQGGDIPPLTFAIGSQITATFVLLPFLAITAPRVHPSRGELFAAIALGLFCTALTYVLYFRLIAAVGATSALTVNLLTPVFGVTWAALFLDETIGPSTIIGGLLVISSVRFVIAASRQPGSPWRPGQYHGRPAIDQLSKGQSQNDDAS